MNNTIAKHRSNMDPKLRNSITTEETESQNRGLHLSPITPEINQSINQSINQVINFLVVKRKREREKDFNYCWLDNTKIEGKGNQKKKSG